MQRKSLVGVQCGERTRKSAKARSAETQLCGTHASTVGRYQIGNPECGRYSWSANTSSPSKSNYLITWYLDYFALAQGRCAKGSVQNQINKKKLSSSECSLEMMFASPLRPAPSKSSAQGRAELASKGCFRWSVRCSAETTARQIGTTAVQMDGKIHGGCSESAGANSERESEL